MDINKEKEFVDRYVVKKMRKRILYELSKPSKRLEALSRFCHNYDSYIDERNIILKGKGITDEKLKEIVKEYGEGNEGYVICWNSQYDSTVLKTDIAIPIMRDEDMCMIFTSGDICIISTEQTQGSKEIVVLRNVTIYV